MSTLPSRPLETALHVRVAEALGWSQIGPGNSMNMGDPGIGYPPVNAIVGHKEPIPRYDEDWSATGPLIVEHQIDLRHHHPKFSRKAFLWEASWWNDETENEMSMNGETPLLAVCNLILALKEAGKL